MDRQDEREGREGGRGGERDRDRETQRRGGIKTDGCGVERQKRGKKEREGERRGEKQQK